MSHVQLLTNLARVEARSPVPVQSVERRRSRRLHATVLRLNRNPVRVRASRVVSA